VCVGAKTRRELKRFLSRPLTQATMMVIYPVGKFANETSDRGTKKKSKKRPTQHNNRTKYVLGVFFLFFFLFHQPRPRSRRPCEHGGGEESQSFGSLCPRKRLIIYTRSSALVSPVNWKYRAINHELGRAPEITCNTHALHAHPHHPHRYENFGTS